MAETFALRSDSVEWSAGVSTALSRIQLSQRTCAAACFEADDVHKCASSSSSSSPMAICGQQSLGGLSVSTNGSFPRSSTAPVAYTILVNGMRTGDAMKLEKAQTIHMELPVCQQAITPGCVMDEEDMAFSSVASEDFYVLEASSEMHGQTELQEPPSDVLKCSRVRLASNSSCASESTYCRSDRSSSKSSCFSKASSRFWSPASTGAENQQEFFSHGILPVEADSSSPSKCSSESQSRSTSKGSSPSHSLQTCKDARGKSLRSVFPSDTDKEMDHHRATVAREVKQSNDCWTNRVRIESTATELVADDSCTPVEKADATRAKCSCSPASLCARIGHSVRKSFSRTRSPWGSRKPRRRMDEILKAKEDEILAPFQHVSK